MNVEVISEVVTPVVECVGLEVDRIEIMNAGKRAVVRIFLDGDGPHGRGPSLDEIATATRAVSNALDEGDVMGERPYVLEVSSRGATRPLTEVRHFRRNVGRLLEVSRPEGRLIGRILGVDEAELRLDVDGQERAVTLAEITKAVVQVELTKGGDADETDVFDDVDEQE